MEENHKAFLKIGEITYQLNLQDNEELNVKKELNKPSTFEAKLLQKNIIPFNYNEEIKVIVERDGQRHILFSGVILISEKYEDKIILKGADPLEMMKEQLLGAEFIKFPVPDIFYHIAKSSGLTPKGPGCFFDGKLLNFKIIIPIKNLSLKDLDYPFLDVKLTKEIDKNINELIQKSEFKNEFINDNITFGIIKISSIDFLEAHKEAIKKLTKVIDWLSFIKQFSLSISDKTLIDWNFKRSKSRPFLSTWFYGEIENTEYRLFMDSEIKKSSETLHVNKDNEDILNLFQSGFNNIYLKNEEDVINAIHWLRRAREFGDHKDKLLDYFTCIEFLVKKQKVTKLIPKSKRKEVVQLCKDILDNTQLDRFENYLNTINEPSFKMRLFSYIEENKISLTPQENENLEATRKKRCLLEHGTKDVDISKKEILLLSNAVEKLILPKLK